MIGRTTLSQWQVDSKFSTFYSGGQLLPFRDGLALCQNGDRVNLVDPGTASSLLTIITEGDTVSTFASDGQSLVITACNNSGLIRVYTIDASLASARLDKSFRVQSGNVRDLALKNDLLAIGSVDGSITVYDIKQGFITHMFAKAAAPVTHLSFHNNRLLLIASYETGDLRVYDLCRHAAIAALQGHSASVTTFDLVPAGDLGGLITAAKNGRICIWELSIIERHLQKALNSIAEDNSILAADHISIGCPPSQQEILLEDALYGNNSKKRKKTDEDNSKKRKKPDENNSKKLEKPDEYNKKLQLWRDKKLNLLVGLTPVTEFNTRESLFTIKCLPTVRTGNCQALSPTGKPLGTLRSICPWTILSGGESGIIKIWNPINQTVLRSWETPHRFIGAILKIDLYKRSQTNDWVIVTTGEDHCIAWWDAKTLQKERILLGQPTEYIHIQFCPVPPAHLATYQLLLRGQKNELPYQDDDDDASTDVSSDLLESLTSQRMLVLRSDNLITLMETLPGRTEFELLEAHTDVVVAADVSVDGCWALSGGKDAKSFLFSTRLHRPVVQFEGHQAPVVAVALSRRPIRKITCTCLKEGPGTTADRLPDNKPLLLATACTEGFLKLWTINRDKVREALESNELLKFNQPTAAVLAHEQGVTAIDMSSGDNFLATCSSDKTVRVFRLPGLEPVSTCRGHRRPVWSVRFAPVEPIVATASADQTVKLFNVTTGQCIKTFQGHTSSVMGAEFLNLGTQILSAAGNGQIKLWAIETAECVGNLNEGHSDDSKIWSLALNSRRNKLATCGTDDQIIIWKDVSAKVKEEADATALEAEKALFEIDNLRRQGKLGEAFELAIEHNRPRKVQTLLESSFETCLMESLEIVIGPDNSLVSGATKMLKEWREKNKTPAISPTEVSSWVADMGTDKLKTLLEMIVKWNTNSKTSNLANLAMSCILNSVPVERLLAVEGINGIVKHFICYSNRHSLRLSNLIQRSYLVDFALTTERGRVDNRMHDFF